MAAARREEEVAGKAEEASQSREGEAAGPSPEGEEEGAETCWIAPNVVVSITKSGEGKLSDRKAARGRQRGTVSPIRVT